MTGQRPAHPVLVEDFQIAHTELTQGQDRAADGSGGAETACFKGAYRTGELLRIDDP